MKTIIHIPNQEKQARILFLAMLFCSLPTLAFAASISIDSAKASFTNNTLTVPVNVSVGTDKLSSLNFTLTYDNTRLSLSNATAAAVAQTGGKQVAYNAISGNTANIIVYGLNTTALTSGALVTLSFALAPSAPDGDATFQLSAAKGASPTATNVTVTATGGQWTLDKTGPVLVLTSPLDKASFGKSSITVSGTVDDLAVTTVKVNSKDVAVSSGKFTTTLTLSDGPNTITVSAVDPQGNPGSISVTVSYIMGDVNEDGIIDSVDIQSALNQFLGKAAFSETADTNADGQINVLDVQKIINRSLGL